MNPKDSLTPSPHAVGSHGSHGS